MSLVEDRFGFLPAGDMEHMLPPGIFGVMAIIVLQRGNGRQNPLAEGSG